MSRTITKYFNALKKAIAILDNGSGRRLSLWV